MNFRKLLLPFSLLYGFATWLRNFFYDSGIFKSQKFSFPVIGVGNLNTGGTGKTPHVEYIIRLLKDNHAIAVLSRGYGRTSKGFLITKPGMDAHIIGDELYQYFLKFPEVIVAAGADRKHAINMLVSKYPGIDAIILDDAFQHRAVKAGLNILLTDYSDLFTNDFVLPAGNLREFKTGYIRAHIIIITKCPEGITEIEKNKIISKINPSSHQKILFSFLKYEALVSFSTQHPAIGMENLKDYEVLLVTGIANPSSAINFLKTKTAFLHSIAFSDHHFFTADDLRTVQIKFDAISSQKKIIVTTEKDFVRLKNNKSVNNLPYYYLPVKVDFESSDKKMFDEIIVSYAGKN